ncbi:TRM11 family SAM-dependent methyltransferase [Clostridium thermarum]|uniref:TRM11 family SAM-dependent methyltransferase n=1 Tax=Clostridium thermarum TaxID=1716543 RepID=UPI0013D43E12|nr:DNA methyltransferase [Clostridium thermarum]
MEKLEATTIWRFKERGSWSTHRGDYPGNWSPYVPRNILLRYSKPGEIVLDQFVGSGTTLIEAVDLGRMSIGCDINPKALEITKQRVDNACTKILNRDARNLYDIEDSSIDLICTHPPYSNIIKYSNNIEGDLSLLSLDSFYLSMESVAKECFRVLKKNKYCAILMGDTRKNGYIVPLAFNIMNIFIRTGFRLKEIVIKEQHNCKSTEYWSSISMERNFLLLAHEYLFILHKSY